MAKLNINVQQALSELKQLIDYLTQLQTTAQKVSGVNAASFNTLNNSLQQVVNTANSVDATFTKLNERMATMETTHKRYVTRVRNLTEENKKLKATNDKLITSEKARRASMRKTQGVMGSLIGTIKSLMAAFGLIAGVALFANIIKNAYGIIKTFDAIGFAMEKITKNAFDLGVSERFLIEITRDFGAELVTTSNRWVKFLAAAQQSGITLMDTQKIFRTMTKTAGVLGLKTDELQGIFLALEQMLSKGKVTTEELRRQLGERLPGAMGIMAASMGVTIVKLDEMLKKGQVLSAEVLPDFADAVDVAYGIEQVEKVETLIAAQTNLSNAWKLFVKFIMEDNHVLRGIFDGLRTQLEAITNFFATDKQKRDLMTIGFSKTVREESNKAATTVFDNQAKMKLSYAALAAQVKAAKKAMEDNIYATPEARQDPKVLEQNHSTLLKQLLNYNKSVQEIERESAKANIAKYKEDFDNRTKEYEKWVKKVEDLNARGVIDYGKWSPIQHADIGLLRSATREVEIQNEKLAKSQAILEHARLLAEESNIEEFKPKDANKGTLKNLREIEDLKEDILINSLKEQIALNNEEIKADETKYERKIELAKENQRMLDEIAVLARDKAIRAINEKADAEIKSNQDYLKDKAIDLETATEEELQFIQDVANQTVKINKERNQKIVIENQKAAADIKQNELNNVAENLTLRDAEWKKEEAIIKQKYDVLIKAENERWDAQTDAYRADIKNAREHELVIAELNHNSVQAQMKGLLVLMKAEYALRYARGENVEALGQAIADLEAKIKNFDPSIDPDKANREMKKMLTDLIGMANDFVQGIGDIFSATFDRRIEYINAEIDAEKKKYDTLIDLARNDNETKLALEKERDVRIAILEAKRLKQEQKAAKIRKAFAVADIAAKLAQTIVAINLAAVEQDILTPYLFGLTGVQYRAIQIGLAVGAAVAQTAAVLSAPIPQYEEGGKILIGHKGMINDGLSQEYIERGNTILTTSNKNAIVDLKPKDIIHPNFEALSKNSLIMTSLAGGKDITERDFNMMFKGIENAVGQGWKKARINNNIKIENRRADSSYANSLSRWSN